MTEDEIRSLILLAGPAEQPSTGTELAELLGRGRRKRKVRGYLVMASSAVSTAAVAVLIVALAVGHSAGGTQVVPANQPAVVPTTSSATVDTTPMPTSSATGTDSPERAPSTGQTTPTTPTSPTSPGSSIAGTTTHQAGTTTSHP